MRVPAWYTFYQLHLAIQGAFGWTNEHLFQFCQNDFRDQKFYGIPDPDFDLEMPVVDARQAKMTMELQRIGQLYSYVYDLGDNWTHRILIENIDGEELSRPICLAGMGACPPEDSGGVFGYQLMLEALKAPRHPEKASFRQWLGLKRGGNWDPELCNLQEINKRMALL
ncbi:MAG: plasmid pRiA4b ORF-3 family protein [Chitinophagaceae bacterium]